MRKLAKKSIDIAMGVLSLTLFFVGMGFITHVAYRLIKLGWHLS